MNIHFYHASSVYSESKEKRVISFVRILAYIILILSVIWMVITLSFHLLPVTIALLIILTSSLIVLLLIRRKKIAAAKLVILFVGSAYFFVVSIFASGFGIPQHSTVHFWFLLSFLLTYFLLYDFKPIIRDTLSILFLTIFFLLHYGYMPSHFMMSLPVEESLMINQITLITFLLILFLVTRLYVLQITQAENALATVADRLEGLIESMLPKKIAERMRLEGKTFADQFHSCSVMFADIIGFTSWSENHSANEVVDHLNNIYSRFDDAVDQLKLTKIKTSGDSYMVASGIPEFKSDHAESLIFLAFELQKIAREYESFSFRIGINSGTATAGVIGKKTFVYDLWGDTVNIASRMESSGEAGKVNISGTTYELVKDKFVCSYRGKIQAKGKGEIDMYFVEHSL